MAGIYIHIPFCKKKCIYCDFYSVGGKTDTVDAYVQSLCQEAAMRSGNLQGEAIKTIYIGGGTPSLLSATQLSRLVGQLGGIFDLRQVEEFTIEVNPDDVTDDAVEAFMQLGINRVSMGVQSFVDAELQFLRRRHDAARAIRAYESIIRCGISNVSIDLIYGIPGQTMQSWQKSLEVAMSLQPKHISCYNLSYEEGTPLYRLLNKGLVTAVDDESCIAMYELMTTVFSNHGYEHYEISNFALPGFYSRHNSGYWDKTPYLGLGASAHSYVNGVRYYNPSDIKVYISQVGDGNIVAIAEDETESERYDEEIMLRLRTSRGLDAEVLRTMYGEPYYSHFMSAVRQFVDSGLVVRDGSVYCLSNRGVMLSDMVFRELMYV